MKPALFALSLALLGVPAVASAQPAPPPDQGAPQARMHGPENPQMRQMHAQMRQQEAQFRAGVLGSLSPANRQLLAGIAGQLAVSPNPDYKGAAARLDRALSANERNAILSAAQSFHQQMRAMHEQMMAQSGNQGPQGGPEGGMGPEHGDDGQAGPGHNGMGHKMPSAGHILLRLSQHGGFGR